MCVTLMYLALSRVPYRHCTLLDPGLKLGQLTLLNKNTFSQTATKAQNVPIYIKKHIHSMYINLVKTPFHFA